MFECPVCERELSPVEPEMHVYKCIDRKVAAGMSAERAAVVRYLREVARHETDGRFEAAFTFAAAEIERGAHMEVAKQQKGDTQI